MERNDQAVMPEVTVEVPQNNIVKISGIIVHKHDSPRIVRVVVATRISGRNGQVYNNYPSLVFTKDKDGHSAVDDFMLHDEVTITGHLSSTYKTRTPMGTPSWQIMGDTVEKAATYSTNAIGDSQGRRVVIYDNAVYVKGVVSQIIERPKVKTIVIECRYGRIRNMVSITAFGNFGKDISVNDEVEVYAYINTSRVVEEGKKPIYRQSIVGNTCTKLGTKTE